MTGNDWGERLGMTCNESPQTQAQDGLYLILSFFVLFCSSRFWRLSWFQRADGDSSCQSWYHGIQWGAGNPSQHQRLGLPNRRLSDLRSAVSEEDQGPERPGSLPLSLPVCRQHLLSARQHWHHVRWLCRSTPALSESAPWQQPDNGQWA